ncbi:glycosyltransferase [Mesorhizobium sp. LCM 4577]|uniref:glycosyltransferase n=1 Tax=Mesorhizobium sp. LCM 4577 TaxID=1848288 RepID=UPI0009F6BC0D|nr:glycosyltransferase [Mesorhizobium sp. LCM 4577]
MVSISVVTCTNDPDGYGEMKDSFLRFAGLSEEIEFIPIRSARSMSAGYNEGMKAARGEWLIFCHDDIRIVQSDSKGLSSAFEAFDVFGVCGTKRCQSSNWYYSDSNDLLGRVVIPGRSASEPDLLEVFSPLTGNCSAQALDGIFIASRSEIARNVRFSEEIEGFTCYDIDFTYRCHLNGHKVGVSSAVLLKHYSKVETFSSEKIDGWRRNQEALSLKFAFHRSFDDKIRHHTVPFDREIGD